MQMNPGVDIMSIVKEYDIPAKFPPEVMEQVSGIENEVSEAEKEGRLDIRGLADRND